MVERKERWLEVYPLILKSENNNLAGKSISLHNCCAIGLRFIWDFYSLFHCKMIEVFPMTVEYCVFWANDFSVTINCVKILICNFSVWVQTVCLYVYGLKNPHMKITTTEMPNYNSGEQKVCCRFGLSWVEITKKGRAEYWVIFDDRFLISDISALLRVDIVDSYMDRHG